MGECGLASEHSTKVEVEAWVLGSVTNAVTASRQTPHSSSSTSYLDTQSLH
jgi:hypothetical protein